jgi:ribosomal-protein-alanine N-acetyltransferase
LVQTDRLTGERPALEHLAAFAALMAEPKVARTMWPGDLGGPRTRGQSETWLRKDIAHWVVNDFGPWLAFERDTGELVGRIGPRITIVEGGLEAELAWLVRPDRWGRGYAGELAAPGRDLLFELGLRSVVAVTLTTNTASRRVMEKLGMNYERDIEHAGLPHVLYRSHPA